MNDSCFRVLEEEIRKVKRMQSDEAWYEGEIRHCSVSKDDPEVTRRVNSIIVANIANFEREAFEQVCFDCHNKDYCINLLVKA